MKRRLQTYYSYFFICLLLPLLIFLSFNKHSKNTYDNYHSVIWADAAGYYMYLPLFFIFDNDAHKFPKNIDKGTGNGFHLNLASNKVETKYFYGVAILEAPFFLVAHSLASTFGFENDGFSTIYHWAIMIAAVFYGCIGLFLLFKVLTRWFPPTVSFLSTLLLLLGTNLYYYTIDASGMSHVYSFFMISATLYFLQRFYNEFSLKNTVIIALCCSISILIRPTNILLLAVVLFYNCTTKESFIQRLKFYKKNIKTVFIFGGIGLCVALPQFLYWNTTFGSFIKYSYTGESFTNWNNPKLIEFWFSTNNGLFLYAPILILFLIGLLKMLRKKVKNAWLIAVLFIVYSYVFSSWWCWWFGCSFGARIFIDWYPLLIIPIAYLVYNSHSVYSKVMLLIFSATCIYINLDMIYYYDGCFYGGTWDFEHYIHLLSDG